MSTYWYGNTISSHWRSYAFYNVTKNATSYTITVSGGFQSIGWGYDLSGVTCTVSIGSSSKSGTGSVSTGTGESKNVRLVSDLKVTINRTTSSQTVTLRTTINRSSASYHAGTSTGTTTITIDPLDHCSITYYGNGNTGGSTASQTKYYGQNIALRANGFTKTGHTFQGWATSSSGGVAYAAGATYTGNAALNLYAVWKANTYTVAFNANGGSGAPASQTKTYGVTLTLSSTRPSRAGWDFVGWGTSASATTASYQPGGSYTANSGTTLYAIWKLSYSSPTIANLVAVRNDGTQDDDEGDHMRVAFSWTVDPTDSGEVSSIVLNTRVKGTSAWTSASIPASGSSGTVNVISTSTFATTDAYDLQVVVTDTHGLSVTKSSILSPTLYTLDFLAGGTGMSIGKPCASDGLHVAWDTTFDGDVYLAHNKRIYGTNSNGESKYVFEPRNASDNCAINYPGYGESNSNTEIYGNNISLQARNRITFNSQTAYPNGTALPNAGNSTDFYAIGINAFANGGIVKYKGLADVKKWLGMGSVDYTDSSWTTPATGTHYKKRAGWVCIIFDNVVWDGTGDGTKFTLPSGYRPSYKLNMLSVNSSDARVYVFVETGGAVKFHRNSTSVSNKYNGVLVFPVA